MEVRCTRASSAASQSPLWNRKRPPFAPGGTSAEIILDGELWDPTLPPQEQLI
jgi:hypothetical protein